MPTEQTYLAVPVALVSALHQLVSQLPYSQVEKLVPALREVMTDEYKVDFVPAQPPIEAVTKLEEA